MKTAGIRELKQNASSVVAQAAAGEIITITDRGRPVARMVPIGGTALEELVAAGRARPPRTDLATLGPPPRRGPGELDLSTALAALRAAERW